MSNTKALPGIYLREPLHGSLCATISIQLTRIQRRNITVSIKIKFFVVLKINFFMITSFLFPETMLKCICLFFGHGFHVLVPLWSGQLQSGIFLLSIIKISVFDFFRMLQNPTQVNRRFFTVNSFS